MKIASPKKRIAQIILGVPTVLFLALALHGISSDYKRITNEKRRLEARTAVAEAAITDLYNSWHSGHRIPKRTVAFTAASGQQVRFSDLADADDKVGTKMPVRYDPHQPGNCALGDVIFGLSDLVWDNAFLLAVGVYFLFLMLRGRLLFKRLTENE